MKLRGRSRLLWSAGGALGLLVLFVVVDRALFGYSGPLSRVQRVLGGESAHATVALSVVARGFREVTDIQFVPGSSKTAIVLVKGGTARHVAFGNGGTADAQTSPIVFEVSVRTNSEMGLLGLAFHPKYRENGLFYVNYSPKEGTPRTRVSEWRLDQKYLGHEKAEELRVILEVEQPFGNHNAGQLAFGPDGMLYIGLGDGGDRADPHKTAQDLSKLLGSMLRIDVDHRHGDKPYAVPPDNPFAGRPGARPEIWAYGLRNPWRYSFDEAGRLIVADVGQDEFEELDIVERGDNLGWVVREGRHCFPPGAKCKTQGFKDPIFEYPRRDGKSIIGGYVYVGRSIPALSRKYVFADYISGNFWALGLPASATGNAQATLLGQWPRAVTTFGRDAAGELYVGDFASGDLLKLVPKDRR